MRLCYELLSCCCQGYGINNVITNIHIWSSRGTTQSSAQCKLIRNQLLCTIFKVGKMQLCIVNAGTK